MGQGWSNNLDLSSNTYRTGNVGIGISSPTPLNEKLEVVGAIKQGNNLLYSDAGNSTLNFNCKYISPGAAPFRLFSQGYSGQFTFGVGLANGGALTYSSGDIGFANDMRALIPRFTVLNNGLMGIGTTNPTELLQIAGGNLHVVNGHFDKEITSCILMVEIALCILILDLWEVHRPFKNFRLDLVVH